MATLAARCSACGTVFRVVQDQLRVAGGLVRCGRCGEVFNATETLIDLDTDTALAPAQARAVSADAPEPVPDPGTNFELQIAPPQPQAAPASAEVHRRVRAEPPQPKAPSEPSFADTPPAATVDADLLTLRADDSDRVSFSAEATHAAGLDVQAEAEEAPSFVRSAERAQRWRRPRVRAGLLLGCALGLLLLAGQAAYTYRDQLAARVPATRDALLSACSALGCRIEAARAIDSLAVESSGLVRVEKSSLYKLQVALRNKAGIAVAMPALDLTLSDSQGKVLARRVLRAAELGVTEATLGAGRDLALQATLQAQLQSTEPIAGYTIELFYP